MQFCGVGWCCCDDLRTTVEAAAMVVMELAEVLVLIGVRVKASV